MSLALCSLLASFVFAEIGLRLYLYNGITWEHSHLPPLLREPDLETGWRLSSNQVAINTSLDYELVVETNSQGIIGAEKPFEASPEEFTVLLLGDSYMEASHVSVDQSFAHNLQEALGTGYRTINLGVGGYSTVQSWKAFESRGKAYNPDLVLLAFYAENDIYGNSAELSCRMWGDEDPRCFCSPFASLDDSGALVVTSPQYDRAREEFDAALKQYNPKLKRLNSMMDSAVERMYKQAISRFRQRVHTPGDVEAIHLGAYVKDPATMTTGAFFEAAWSRAQQTTDAVLVRLSVDAADAGANFGIFTVPSKLQTEPGYFEVVRARFPEVTLDLELPHRHLAALCESNAIPFRDLLPDFRDAIAAGHQLNYAVEDSHWNPAGHALAAILVAEWIREKNLLAGRKAAAGA
jgi:lysophospholipase L1-like esterase